MNKLQLAGHIASDSGLSQTQAMHAIDAFTSGVKMALKKGDRVTLLGFGAFSVAKRAARNGRNPQTGKTIKISARTVPKFTAASDLKKIVRKAAA
jgi:DNA-binding protein HU-beta